jgi:pimeloyl-ACP methyl ester carboxylesterase
VFLHGITANRHHWDPVVALLAARYRCVNVDLLAHGESPPSESTDLFAQMAAVTGLLQHLGIERPVLLGHSFGGFVATFTATAVPLSGVVNVDQGFDMAGFRAKIAPLEAQLRSDDCEAAFDEFVKRTERPELVPAERQDLLWSNIRPHQEVLLSVWSVVFDTPPEELRAQIESTLPAVGAPYLALFGDPISDEEQRLQDLIPDGQVEVWADHGHFPHLVDPERAAHRIAAFVDGTG